MGFVAQAVVHEVDNPLTHAINNVALLERYLGATLPEARLQEALTLCARVRLGLRGVRDAMQDVRVFAESAGEEPSLLDLHLVLDSVTNLAAFELSGRAHLVKRYGAVPPVIGTRTRLGQVFADILVYAAQTAPLGDARDNEVTVSTHPQDGNVVVEIDSAGARAEEIATDPSFAIARTMLADDGGALAVKGRKPHGATFLVTLRAATHGVA